MAVLTRHPVSQPPGPPPRATTGHLALRAWCTFVIFSTLAGVAWVNAFGAIVAGIVAVASGIITVIIWASVRPIVQWRRLPWFPLLTYVAYAGVSVLWSGWPGVTALTWLLLAISTVNSLFLAVALSWRELIRALGAALKWCIGLSVAFELIVSVFVGGPILPGFQRPDAPRDPVAYWSRDNLFDGGRLQGIWGDANSLGIVSLTTLIVIGVLLAARKQARATGVIWLFLAGYLWIRADSATAYMAAAGAVAAAIGMLLMRGARNRRQRRNLYLLYLLVIGTVLATIWFGRDRLFSLLGRSADLTGRTGIWDTVTARAEQRPVFGWGFASPWLPWDPAFDGWIVDHSATVIQAHSAWLDIRMQLGWVGVTLLALVYIAMVWRAWFFAVDRPRYDLNANRPYSPLSLLPGLLVAVILVQSVTESEPLTLAGWMLVATFAAKIKQSPLIGVGTAERSDAIERGDLTVTDR